MVNASMMGVKLYSQHHTIDQKLTKPSKPNKVMVIDELVADEEDQDEDNASEKKDCGQDHFIATAFHFPRRSFNTETSYSNFYSKPKFTIDALHILHSVFRI